MKEGKRKENIDDDEGDAKQHEVYLRMQAAELADQRKNVEQLDLHPAQGIPFDALPGEVEAFISENKRAPAIRIITGLGEQGKLKKMVRPWIEKHSLVEVVKDEGGSFFVLLKQ